MIRDFLKNHLMTLTSGGTYLNGLLLMYVDKIDQSAAVLDTAYGQFSVALNALLIAVAKIWSKQANDE